MGINRPGDHSQPRVLPADQGFDREALAAKIDLRLVVKAKLPVFDRAMQFPLQFEAFQGGRVHLRRKNAMLPRPATWPATAPLPRFAAELLRQVHRWERG